MTRENIIKWLESLKAEIGKPEHRTLWHYEEAIDMAIESLQAEKCDLISRADALNEIQEFGRDVGCLTSEQIADVQRRLRKIPSAEAVTHGRLIDADTLSKKLCETTLFVKDGEVFQRMINDAPTVSVDEQIQSMVEKRVAELVHLNHELEQQLADRPHGEWIEPQLIYTDAHKVTCTNCGERVVIVGKTNFCPNCGARMTPYKGGDDE